MKKFLRAFCKPAPPQESPRQLIPKFPDAPDALSQSPDFPLRMQTRCLRPPPNTPKENCSLRRQPPAPAAATSIANPVSAVCAQHLLCPIARAPTTLLQLNPRIISTEKRFAPPQIEFAVPAIRLPDSRESPAHQRFHRAASQSRAKKSRVLFRPSC